MSSKYLFNEKNFFVANSQSHSQKVDLEPAHLKNSIEGIFFNFLNLLVHFQTNSTKFIKLIFSYVILSIFFGMLTTFLFVCSDVNASKNSELNNYDKSTSEIKSYAQVNRTSKRKKQSTHFYGNENHTRSNEGENSSLLLSVFEIVS